MFGKSTPLDHDGAVDMLVSEGRKTAILITEALTDRGIPVTPTNVVILSAIITTHENLSDSPVTLDDLLDLIDFIGEGKMKGTCS